MQDQFPSSIPQAPSIMVIIVPNAPITWSLALSLVELVEIYLAKSGLLTQLNEKSVQKSHDSQ